MPVLENLFVRLGADVTPLISALGKIEKVVVASASRMEAALCPVEGKLAALSTQKSGRPESVSSPRGERRATQAAPTAFGPVVVPMARLGAQVVPGLIASLLADTILSDDVDPLEAAKDRAGGDIEGLRDEILRFRASAELLRRQASKSLGKGEFVLLGAAEEEDERANALLAELTRIRDEGERDFPYNRNMGEFRKLLSNDEQDKQIDAEIAGMKSRIKEAQEAIDLVTKEPSLNEGIEGTIARTQPVDPVLRDLLESLQQGTDLCSCLDEHFEQNSLNREDAAGAGGGVGPAAFRADDGNGAVDGPSAGRIAALTDELALQPELEGGRARLAAGLRDEAAARGEATTAMAAYNAEASGTAGALAEVDEAIADTNASLPQATALLEDQTAALADSGRSLAAMPGEWERVREEGGRLGELGEGLGFSLGRAFEGALLGGRAFGQILKQLEGELTRLLGSTLFGAGGVGGFLGGGLGTLFQGATAGLFHEGGLVGRTAVPRRRVPASLFAGAARMHKGGIAGLRPGEVPAILQTGELVVPRGALAREAAAPAEGGQGDTFVVNVNGVSDFDSFQRSEGQMLAMLGQAVALARRRHL